MTNEKTVELINEAYYRLELKCAELMEALYHRMFRLENGWYSGHYRKNEKGNWQSMAYPIPVISVQGICEIEIHFDQIIITARLDREDALLYAAGKLAGYTFKIYGADAPFREFYSSDQPRDRIKQTIAASDEKVFTFSFEFPFETETEDFVQSVKQLRRENLRS